MATSLSDKEQITDAELRDIQQFLEEMEQRKQASVAADIVPRAKLAPITLEKELQQPWLWPGRVPVGHVTLLAGPPGVGKSLLALDWAARLSRGMPWPDGAVNRVPAFAGPHRTLLLAGEDSGWTVRRRLAAMGADLDRVLQLPSVSQSGQQVCVDLARHWVAIGEALKSEGDVRLMVVDPLACFSRELQLHHPGQARRVMDILQKLAVEHAMAVVAVTHLSKSQTARGLERAMGSVSLAAAARAVYFVAPDPHDPRRKLLLAAKQNLAAEVPALVYRIVPDASGEPTLQWEQQPASERLDDVLVAQRKAATYGQSDRACDFLLESLSAGPRPAAELLRAAMQQGIRPQTLRRAKSALGVRSLRQGFGPQSVFLWQLSEEFMPLPRDGGLPASPDNSSSPAGILAQPL